jgi:putative transposase
VGHHTTSSIPSELNRIFPAQWLRFKAIECGAKARVRCIDIAVFFWCLVMAPTVGACQSLMDMQRLFQAMGSIVVARSSFLKRFNDGFVKFLIACIHRAIEYMGEEIARPGLFDSFKDVLAIDSTVIALADGLARAFPGTRKNSCPSAAKLNAVMSVVTGSMMKVAVAAERTAELKFLKIGSWVKDLLLIFDLGYYSHGNFERIDHFRGFFVSRLMASVNPTILADNTQGPGRRRDLRGRKVRDAIKGLSREVIDVMAKVSCRRKIGRPGKKNYRTVQTTKVFRVVGCYNEQARQYHLYITNVGVDVMTPEQIAAAYTARWIVENAFLELKHRYSMNGIPGKRPEVVRALILVAVLNLLVNRAILDLLRRRLLLGMRYKGRFERSIRLNLVCRTPTLRFATVFAVYGPLLIPDILRAAGMTWSSRHIEDLMMLAMIDPNRKRELLLDRLEAASGARADA